MGTVPDHPILFASSVLLTGANTIIIPRSEKNRMESSVARRYSAPKAQHVSESGLRYLHVAGYATFKRRVRTVPFQTEFGGQWFKGKSCDSFCRPSARSGDRLIRFPDPQKP